MEVAVAMGLMSSLLPKLGELLKEEHKLKNRVKKDVESLSLQMETINAALHRVAEAPRDQLDEQVQLWANDVKEMAYKIEGAIDPLLLRIKGFEEPSGANKHRVKRRIILLKKIGSKFTSRHRMADAIKSIKDQVEDVAAKQQERVAVAAPVIKDDSAGFVRLREARNLTKMLAVEDDSGAVATKELKILSIVGPGGLGKTTLAKVVYDSLRSHFYCAAFVSLSRNPDMKSVFKDLLLQIGIDKEYSDLIDEKQLIDNLRKQLRGKRYLVVIDDIWDIESWEIMRCALLDSNCGSRVITTTRIMDVAAKADDVYKLKPLSPEESKIASLLANKPIEYLSKVGNSISISQGYDKYEEDTMNILPCKHLQRTTLKGCLLYLATTGEKQRIERGVFVRKWISEGFVSDDGWYNREEVANQYFDELVNMSVIQLAGHDHDFLGEETYEFKYSLLDVLRLISEQEHFITFLPGNGISNPSVEVPAVRLFMEYSDSESYSETKQMDLSRVRSVKMHGSAPPDVVSYKHLEFLRVLDLDGYKDLDNFAMDDICRMILLKYLSLKQTKVSELPSQIRKLLHLETLDVRQTQVKELPHEVVQLPRLAHLLFGQTSSLGGVKLPAGSNQLKSVMVLGTIDSRECSACVMEEISELKQVREVSVVLHDGPADKERNDNLLSSIGKCGNVRLLQIYGDSSTTSDVLPASLHLPLLDELKVVGTFVKVPRWIAQLRAIEKLQMRVCKLEPNDLIILGGLPALTTLALALVGIPRKLMVISSGAGFPCLEVFSFDCRVPWITFQKGSMQSLKHLQLKLYIYPADKSPSGVMHLEKLNKVTICYSSRYASSEGVAKTVAVMREEVASHGNLIELCINGDYENYLFSPSKAKVGARITATQVDTTATQVDTRVSKVITGSEIEEEW